MAFFRILSVIPSYSSRYFTLSLFSIAAFTSPLQRVLGLLILVFSVVSIYSTFKLVSPFPFSSCGHTNVIVILYFLCYGFLCAHSSSNRIISSYMTQKKNAAPSTKIIVFRSIYSSFQVYIHYPYLRPIVC